MLYNSKDLHLGDSVKS